MLMNWGDIYNLSKIGDFNLTEVLPAHVIAEPVFVKYEGPGYIYGFDWLSNNAAQERKQLIQEKSPEFLYFTKPSNKGTIQTAGMLVESQSDEERTAIWIAATAKELSEYNYGNNSIRRFSNMIYSAAYPFLKDRYSLWHHATKKLVPAIMLPSSVLENMVCKDIEPIIELIQLNTLLLKNTWRILQYSSIKDDNMPKFLYRITD